FRSPAVHCARSADGSSEGVGDWAPAVLAAPTIRHPTAAHAASAGTKGLTFAATRVIKRLLQYHRDKLFLRIRGPCGTGEQQGTPAAREVGLDRNASLHG